MPDRVILEDLPCTIRGFCYHDNDGNTYVVINSRLSEEQRKQVYDHEIGHIVRNEMYDSCYNEYGGVS